MLSKTLTAYFVTVQVFFGFDYGLKSIFSKRTQMAMNCAGVGAASVVLSSIVVLIDGLDTTLMQDIEYIILFLLLKSTKYTVYHFLTDLEAVDKKWRLMICDTKSAAKIWAYTFTMFLLKWAVSLTHCLLMGYNDTKSIAFFLLAALPLTVLDAIPAVHALLFHNVAIRLGALRNGLETGKYQITDGIEIFRNIADCLDKLRKELDSMIFTSFIFETAKLIACYYKALFFLKRRADWFVILIASVYPIHYTLQIILPAVFAEMMSAEVENVKMIAHERLLHETGAEEANLLRFTRYLESRGLVRKAWRLVPVDLRLPVAVLHISATYIIVIIQFTHLI